MVLSHLITLVVVSCLAVGGCEQATAPGPSGSVAPASLLAPSPTSLSGAPSPDPSAFPSPRIPGSPTVSAVAPVARWEGTGVLREPRNATNVVVVRDGRVLVVGSDYQTSWLGACGAATNGSDSVELGDPSGSTWATTTRLPTPREAPAVIALADGRALVTGGERGENDGNISYSSTYIFDPDEATWTRSGLMNSARSNPAVALLADGRVLVAGGRFIDGAHAVRMLDSSETWDPSTGTWSRAGRLGHARVGASAVSLADGRVLIVGGVASQEAAPFEQQSAEIFDPESGRWSSAGALTTARSGFALVALADGGAIVAGGFGGSAGFIRVATVERFDPAANTWSSASKLPSPIVGASGVRLGDGRVLLAGGSVRDPEMTDLDAGTYVTGFTADAQLFDPRTGHWTGTAALPAPRAGASIVALGDGSAVLVGGSSGEGPAETPGCPEPDPQVMRYVPGS